MLSQEKPNSKDYMHVLWDKYSGFIHGYEKEFYYKLLFSLRHLEQDSSEFCLQA